MPFDLLLVWYTLYICQGQAQFPSKQQIQATTSDSVWTAACLLRAGRITVVRGRALSFSGCEKLLFLGWCVCVCEFITELISV